MTFEDLAKALGSKQEDFVFSYEDVSVSSTISITPGATISGASAWSELYTTEYSDTTSPSEPAAVIETKKHSELLMRKIAKKMQAYQDEYGRRKDEAMKRTKVGGSAYPDAP